MSYAHANTFLGVQAGQECNSNDNVVIGYQAGMGFLSGGSNVIIGKDAAGDLTAKIGTGSVIIGRNAGEQSNGGDGNVNIGFSSGRVAGGSYNTFVGLEAGQVTQGNANVCIGYGAQAVNTYVPLISASIMLGSKATALSSNQFVLGSTQFPLLTTGGSTTPASAVAFLRVFVNGQDLKLPLYT
jgi:hypothetical protein